MSTKTCVTGNNLILNKALIQALYRSYDDLYQNNELPVDWRTTILGAPLQPYELVLAGYITKMHYRCPTWPASIGGLVSRGNKYVLFVLYFDKMSFCSENPLDRCEVSNVITTDTSCLYYDPNIWAPWWELPSLGRLLKSGGGFFDLS